MTTADIVRWPSRMTTAGMVRGRSRVTTADLVVVDVSADRLLLRAADEPDDYSPPSWPVTPGPVLACTPAISRRPDLFALLHEVLPELLGGCAVPVRLLLEGSNSTSHWSDELRMLSADLGIPVVLEPPEAPRPDTEPNDWYPVADPPDHRGDVTALAHPAPSGPPTISAATLLAPRQWDHLDNVVLTPTVDPDPAVPPLPPALPPLAASGGAWSDGPPVATPSMAPPPEAEDRSVAALRLDPADLADDEWPALRPCLNGTYDAHARVITRALSEQPGLRRTGTQLAGDLIAVRAVCSEQSESIRRVLRQHPSAGAGPSADETDRIIFLARAARQGLRRLPTVLGPVFRPASVSPDHLAAYRAGSELFEPSFLDADLAPSQPPRTTVQFAIWSYNGRRVDVLTPANARPVLFPPETVFCVLAIDRHDDEPAWVLLMERGFGESDERMVASLRAAATASLIDSARLDDLAIGLHDGDPFKPGP